MVFGVYFSLALCEESSVVLADEVVGFVEIHRVDGLILITFSFITRRVNNKLNQQCMRCFDYTNFVKKTKHKTYNTAISDLLNSIQNTIIKQPVSLC